MGNFQCTERSAPLNRSAGNRFSVLRNDILLYAIVGNLGLQQPQ